MALAAAGCGSNMPEGQQRKNSRLNPPQPVNCKDTKDFTICRDGQKEIQLEWQKAIAGDYDARRNIAFVQSVGAGIDRTHKQDAVQACAWRTVILRSNVDRVDKSDLINFDTDCGRLVDSDRASAEKLANIITSVHRR